MRVLVTNDDGIHSPGLAALADAARTLGDVTVVAPAVEQSGVGLSITYRHPLMLSRVRFPRADRAWEVHGSPADCAKLGVLELCERHAGGRPDVVLSGINVGANVGISVLYSGTVAGAIEGAFHGVTSVAVSSAERDPDDWAARAEFAVGVVRRLLDGGVPAASLWNLNLPRGEIGPLVAAPAAAKRQGDVLTRRESPEGAPYYWTGMDPAAAAEPHPHSDAGLLAAGRATLTPLRHDLTDPAGFGVLRELGIGEAG